MVLVREGSRKRGRTFAIAAFRPVAGHRPSAYLAEAVVRRRYRANLSRVTNFADSQHASANASSQADRAATGAPPSRLSGSAPAVALLMKNELLGDAITRIPALRALRFALPDHRIVGLYKQTTAWLSTLAQARGEFLDEILIGQPIADGASAIRRTLRSIDNLQIVLDFRANLHSWSSFLATSGLNVKYVANVAGFMLRRGVPLGIEMRPDSNVRCYHRAVELALGRTLPFEFHLTPPADAVARAETILSRGASTVLLACGNPRSNKFWPREGWVGLARHLLARGITPTFLLGIQEASEREWIAREIPQARIVDASVAANAEQLPWLFVALARNALAAVTVEGGIGHLIATSGIPILTIAGPTNPVRWRPVTPLHWTVWAREFGSKETAAVPLEAVVARTEEMLRVVARR